MKSLYSALAVVGLIFAGSAQAEKYTIDGTHTQVRFTYNHFGFSNITGRFDQVQGEFDLDTANLAKSRIAIEIPIASISTGVDKLDTHLQSADFFDAAKYPTARFNSKSVHVVNEKELHVSGDLTIHGVTQPVTFTVKINRIGEHPFKKVPAAGFDATATLKRSAFGIGGYVPLVSDDVTLSITLEATVPKS